MTNPPLFECLLAMKTHLCRTLFRLLLVISAIQVSAVEPSPAQAETQQTPETAWTTELHTGALWSIGNNASPLNYRLLPQLITVKTPAHWEFQTGTLVWRVRSRASLELTPVIQGPESYFLGVTFAPSLEWWNEARTVSTFFSAGGGFGWMDAQGQTLPGAQGQDFNLTWFIHTGLSWQITPQLSASLGARFQHISNGGRNDINPGIDAFGPTLGLGWSW
jgi:lipid A 3-O-deacylase